MKVYTLGFAFSEGKVLLIKKNYPEWQKGKFNGLGGSVEEGENPKDAMVREFLEESGIQTIAEDWIHFASLTDIDNKAIVLCYKNIVHGRDGIISKEGLTKWVHPTEIDSITCLRNLPYLVLMAKNHWSFNQPVTIVYKDISS